YTSRDSSKSGIRIIEADGSNERNLVDNEDVHITYKSPLWSPNGNQIAFLSTNTGEGSRSWDVWIANVGTGNIKKLAEYSQAVMLLGWGATGTELVVATVEGKPAAANTSVAVNLFRVSTNEGSQRLIHRISSEDSQRLNLQLSRDGKSIAFVSQQNGKDNLWVIPAAGGEARKITANNDPRLYFSSLAWSADGKAVYFSKHMKWTMTAIIENFK